MRQDNPFLKTINNLAPIVLFVYNRPRHTRQTVEALKKNKLAKESELFIYSDAPKNQEAENSVEEVRQYIQTIDGFKKVINIEQEKNLGLAKSIIQGVTDIVNKYGKIIVLEDDHVTSSYFLKFMNDTLNFYEDKQNVWHISGWNYPIPWWRYPVKRRNSKNVFLWRIMNCWGWATWAERWQQFEKNTDRLMTEFTKDEIFRFNLDGEIDFWNQVIANKNKEIDTWAIYWYATIFNNNGLCLNPRKSFVRNIGLDSSGAHCSESYGMDNIFLNNSYKMSFQDSIVEDKNFVEMIKNDQRNLRKKKNVLQRVINKISRKIIKKNLVR